MKLKTQKLKSYSSGLMIDSTVCIGFEIEHMHILKRNTQNTHFLFRCYQTLSSKTDWINDILLASRESNVKKKRNKTQHTICVYTNKRFVCKCAIKMCVRFATMSLYWMTTTTMFVVIMWQQTFQTQQFVHRLATNSVKHLSFLFETEVEDEMFSVRDWFYRFTLDTLNTFDLIVCTTLDAIFFCKITVKFVWIEKKVSQIIFWNYKNQMKINLNIFDCKIFDFIWIRLCHFDLCFGFSIMFSTYLCLLRFKIYETIRFAFECILFSFFLIFKQKHNDPQLRRQKN